MGRQACEGWGSARRPGEAGPGGGLGAVGCAAVCGLRGLGPGHPWVAGRQRRCCQAQGKTETPQKSATTFLSRQSHLGHLGTSAEH